MINSFSYSLISSDELFCCGILSAIRLSEAETSGMLVLVCDETT
ncbi:MAG TPA: hypothetical protein PKH79_03645 [Prolixibacteraceae bacterium]|nr:hypothetical protein [Prolixibacteraceae bacterium]HPS11772.1 hypothetical protein [Prolixibacteraceae bacterium]